MTGQRSLLLGIVGAVLAILGLALAAGGGWLVLLGGSAFYLPAGVAMLAVGLLVLRRHAAALPVYAALLAVTLAWALWEVGLAWWPLAARGGLPVLLGMMLLLPPVARRLHASALRGGGLALSAVLLASLGVAAASWLQDPHRVAGRAPDLRSAPTADAAVPPGEWHAYGRTPYGQRFSPLDQVTPANVARLEVAWTYNTGDVRGEPKETTFQVTPLKIGNRLFLCTPHQSVIALDATTGAEIWRTELRLRGNLALQHLTCRGLGFHPGPGEAD
jgi:quinoprotein glucose dehydrogenase